MGRIKHRSLATGSMAGIKPSEPLFLDLISTADPRADGYDGFVLNSSAPAKLGAGRCHHRGRWGAPSSPYTASFSNPKVPTRSRRWELSVLTTYRGGDGPWRAGDGNPFSPTLGGGAGCLWGSSIVGENSYEGGGPCRSSWGSWINRGGKESVRQ
jgi:hypothetical protein